MGLKNNALLNNEDEIIKSYLNQKILKTLKLLLSIQLIQFQHLYYEGKDLDLFFISLYRTNLLKKKHKK